MTDKRHDAWRVSRRRLLQGAAGMAVAGAFGGLSAPARAAGGKVIIGAFADGGLTPFKEKIIPLAKAEGGVRHRVSRG